MKLLLMIICICFNLAVIPAQTVCSDNKMRATSLNKNQRAQLQLTTSIIEKNYYCVNRVALKLRLAFKNVGGVPIILDRESFIVRQMVSRDLKAAEAKQYESVGRFIYSGNAFGFEPVDMSNFIVLKSGEVYTADFSILAFSISDEAIRPDGYLSAGTHLLEIEVGTWPYNTDYEPYQQKWKDKGFLWAPILVSQPMPFTIEKNGIAFKPCRS